MNERDATARDKGLNELVEELLARFDAEGPPALEALCREHPEHAAGLRRRYALLGESGVLVAPAELEVPDKLGEFRLVRMLGGGGMGVVYLAVQEPLGREVALKIVRPEHLYFPGTRERFRREVDAIARLQHPGIVPIYAVGEQSGVPYFAMERVLGASLENVLERLRGRDPRELNGHDLAPAANESDYLFRGTWEQACLRVIRQVAEALEYAHQQGVLHRDIKPSNVMLTSHGGSRAMLLDFGLATASGATRLTRSGAQLGTLHYMSPEQASGDVDAVTPRSDVYSLAVTLYELLTLRRPFDGANEVEIALAIQHGHCKRPRELNPALSEEAEIVCLAALDHDAARRYPSAADFARDLGNVLDQHPIEARRPSTVVLVRKWTRRHPAASVAIALGACVLVGGPALYGWQQQRGAALLRVERDRAESNLGQALAAVDRMLTRVSQEELRFEPRMEKLRTALLQDAVDLLRKLLAEQRDDPRLRMETAQAHERLGSLLAELGRAAEARRAYDAALDLLGGAEPSPTLDNDRAHLFARVSLLRAGLAAEGNEVVASRAELARVRAALEKLVERWPNDLDLRAATAASDAQMGTLLREAGEPAESRRLLEQALAEQQRVVDASGDPEHSRALAELANEYAILLLQDIKQGERNADAEEWLQRSVDLFARAVELSSGDNQYRYKLATARSNLAGVLRRAENFDDARAMYAQAQAELEALVRDFPETPWFDFELATVHNQIGLLEDIAGNNELASASYVKAVEHFEALSRRLPESYMVLTRFGTASLNAALLVMRVRGPSEARPYAEHAIRAQQRALEVAPERADVGDLAGAWRAMHNVLLELGDLRGAAEAVESMVRAAPDAWSWRTRAAAGFARCLAKARDSSDISGDEFARMEREFSERACAHLRAALERGMPDPSEIRDIDVLEPLHGTAAFEQLLRELN